MDGVRTYQRAVSVEPLIEGLTRDELIHAYLPKVRLIAGMISTKVGGRVEFDDLLHAGLIGLLDAIDKFDATRANKFSTYAEFRVRGAILDSLRGMDLLSRTARDKANHLRRTLDALREALGREPSQEEAAGALGLSLDGYHHLLDEVKAVTLLSLDERLDEDDSGRSIADTLPDDRALNALEMLSDGGMREVMKKAIHKLPERLKHVILLYYFKEMTFREIGKTLDLSEARICQLHTEAILRLRHHADKLLTV